MARRRYRGKKRRTRGGSFFLGLLLVAAGAWWVVTTLFPNQTYTVPDWRGMDKPIFVQGELKEQPARGSGEELLLPITVIQESVDANIRYEEETESVLVTTSESVLRMKMESTKGELNGKAVTIPYAPKLIDGIAYVPIKPLKQHYGVSVHEDSATGAIILMRAGDSIQLAEAAPGNPEETVALRESGEKKSPIVLDMPAGERLRVWREEEGRLFVQADNGYTGYVPKEQVKLGDVKEIPMLAQTPSRAELEWKNKSVNLAWEAVYNKNPSTDSIGELPGVNVVSPTWFSIVDGEGTVKSKAVKQYVSWAHNRNMEVWGLMDNSFDPDMTTEALSTFDRRSHIIKQMLAYAKQYKLDGINIDFENVHTKDKDHVVQFVREMKPLAKARGLIVSIDVTPKSNSEMWSLFLDRKRLGETVDYMMVMAYDEHWAASPKAGSVSSLPWAEQSVRRIMEEDAVPSSKLVLGVPLYTRVWTETSEAGETKVSSKAIGMEKLQALLKEQKVKGTLDAGTGQNYVQFTEGESIKKIWMEDGTSLQSRVNMAKKLKLGGIASWNRSFAIPETWHVLKTIHE
ncbi:glycosyl hydrolase family 18 protein [Paenibacillus sp. FSL W7-1279]|uniref:glycosyl hydrolase family 18 protein n=1 Tax=Paenibacillus sp. FSL W7-1279 TaxID=2921697 RepID=UPI0030D86761